MSVRLTSIIIYSRRFESCFRFYQKVFGLKPVQVYRGKRHPRWVQFQLGDVLFALHAGYPGPAYSGEPIWIHFEVEDIRRVLRQIRRYGGNLMRPLRRVERFPEGWVVDKAGFADPDGNQFEVHQVLEELSE